MKPEYTIAARALVEFALRSGNLEFGFMPSSRTKDAIRAHQKLQKSRPTNYRSEVSIDYRLETDTFILKIGGRIDGIYEQAESVILEEIKTTTRELTHFEKNENKIHWGQLKLYAYIYTQTIALTAIETHLTYYQLDSHEVKTIARRFDIETLAIFFNTLINTYISWMQAVDAAHKRRQQSSRKLEFPFPTYRTGQRQMAVAVYRTIKDSNQLLVQAPTGIGKTMATLFPAIKAFAENLCDKIFYLTARTTGRMVAEKSLNGLRNQGLRLKSITLTAKDKICLNPGQACHPDECDVARGHYDRIEGALTEIYQQDAITPERISECAQRHRVCPFELSLDLSLWADVIICDYNYAFDPRVYLKRFFQDEPDDFIFLIDEAHNLVDRSREMFSASIEKQTFLEVRRALGTDQPAIKKSLTKINTLLVKERKTGEAQNNFISSAHAPDDLLPLCTIFLRVAEKWLALNEKTAFREALLTLYFEVTNFLRIAELYNDTYMTVYKNDAQNLSIKLMCMDPSTLLNAVLNRCRTAIFFSATMTPLTYFKYIFGCRDSAQLFTLPSPFPQNHLGLFMYDTLSTLYKHRDSTAVQLTDTIFEVVNQKKGNYIIYFPSYAYMSRIFDLFVEKATNIELLCQSPSMSETERLDFIDHFQVNNPRTMVGFAVLGGIFGEGIDLVGERLCGSVIVGVGLPAISAERDLLKNYFENKFKEGFAFAYLYPGINRVLQSAGRVIRTEQDRGIVILIDHRYNTYRYRSLLPIHWRPCRIPSYGQLSVKINNFWSMAECSASSRMESHGE